MLAHNPFIKKRKEKKKYIMHPGTQYESHKYVNMKQAEQTEQNGSDTDIGSNSTRALTTKFN